jgi:hypothetical protein
VVRGDGHRGRAVRPPAPRRPTDQAPARGQTARLLVADPPAWDLPGGDEAGRQAVRCVEHQLAIWGLAAAAPRVARVAAAVASAVAGRGPCRLTLDLAVLSDGSEAVRVEVCAAAPAPRLPATALRGLESESVAWNALRHPAGVLVWAHVPALPPPEPLLATTSRLD